MKKVIDFVNNRPSYVLIGILLLAILLRVYHINYQSLWVDELFSIVPTSPSASLASIIEYCKSDQPPFFFFYIHYVFKIFGYNEVIGRLASAAIGILSIVVVYLLGKECADKQSGLFAAMLTAVNYFHIYYSQELRFYSLCFLLSAVSYLYFIRAYKKNRVVDFFGYMISTIALLYTHYFGIFVFIAQGFTFFFLVIYKSNRKFVFWSIASGIIIIVAYLPWLPTILYDLGAVLSHIKRPSAIIVIQYFYIYTGKDAVSTIFFCLFIFLFIKSVIYERHQDSRPLYIVIIIWILITYLIPYLRSILVTPMLADRYTIVTLPAWIVLFAIGWSKINNLKIKYPIVAVLGLAAIINLFFFKQHYTRLKKDQWRESSEFVISNNANQYPVYSSMAWHYSFYFRDQPKKITQITFDNLPQTDKFWFLVAHLTEDEMEAQIKKMQSQFVIVEHKIFFGANAVLFKKK